MKILLVISNPKTADALLGISEACSRAKQQYSCFFTGDGVTLLKNDKIVAAIETAERNVACEHSWEKHCASLDLPIEKGSQTDHSAMISMVDRVVSL